MMSIHSSTKSALNQQSRQPEPIRIDGGRQMRSVLSMSLLKNKTTAITGLILMLVTLPLILLLRVPASPQGMTATDADLVVSLYKGLLTGLTLPISLVILILAAGLMFSFLHHKPALDVFHALPVRRLPMYLGRFTAGYLLVFLPQLATFLVVFAIRFIPALNGLSIALLIETALSVFLMTLAAYAVSVLAFIVTGTVFDALFLIMLLNAAYPATLATVEFFTSLVLPGFTLNTDNMFDRYMLLAPFARLTTVIFVPFDLFGALWWIGLTGLLGIGGFLVYRRRKSELAGTPFAYRTPFLITRFLVCLVIGLFFGYLFHQFQPGLLIYGLGVLTGSFAAHLVIEVILSRGFGAFKRSLPSYGAYLAVFAAGSLIISTGFFGFDYRMPAGEQITRVELTTNELQPRYQSVGQPVYPSFQEPENVALILRIHELYLADLRQLAPKPYTFATLERLQGYGPAIAERFQTGDEGPVSRIPCRIAYSLRSGGQMVRTVYIDFSQDPYAGLIRQLKDTAEYKMQKYVEFLQPVTADSALYLLDKTGQVLFSLDGRQSKDRLEKLQEAIRTDLDAGADMAAGQAGIGYLTNYGTASLELTGAFTHVLAVMDEFNLSYDVVSVARRYAAAYIGLKADRLGIAQEMNKMSGDETMRYYPIQYYPDGNPYAPLLSDQQSFIRVTDPALIEQLYLAGETGWPDLDDGYLVLFAVAGQVTGDGYANTPLPALHLAADQVPAELAALLKEQP